MKKQFFMLLTVVATLFATTACEKGNHNNNDDNGDVNGKDIIEVDATGKNTWHYFDVTGKLIGSADDSNIADWDARSDWDFAIQRYVVRTKVGVYRFDEGTEYASINEIPNNAKFVEDAFRNVGMPSKRLKVSDALVARMSGMPPVWSPTSPYAVLSADKSKAAKISFLSYQKVVDVDGTPTTVSGHVSFKIAVVPTLDYTVVKGEDDPEVTYMSSDDTKWSYFTLNGIFVGTGADADDAAWKARNDWDLAIKMSSVRTNSGTSTSYGQGGVHKFDDAISFDDVTALPSTPNWIVDELVASPMDGDSVSKSPESLIKLDMSNMPPAFNAEQNVFALRSADGSKYSKIIFTGYSKEDDTRITSFNISSL